jgi:hypothetical protein
MEILVRLSKIELYTLSLGDNSYPLGAYQFGSHYSSGRGVLGFLLRIEPFTTLWYNFDTGGDPPNRIFHILGSWFKNLSAYCDQNLELIPQFYYLPQFLENNNYCNFGVKETETELADSKFPYKSVRVDDAKLPPWAPNTHIFVKKNNTVS